MSRKRVIVLGASFAGLTAAVELRARLPKEHEVVVLAAHDRFVFSPALVRVPFGERTKLDVSFEIPPALERHGVRFKMDPVTKIDLDDHRVETTFGSYDYDYLLLATGAKLDFGAVRGLGPEGRSDSIFTLEHAMRLRDRLETWIAGTHGPIVVGLAPGASYFFPTYEFLFLLVDHLERAGVERPEITFVTPEPYLGHFGVGGYGRARTLIGEWMRTHDVDAVVDASIEAIADGEIHHARRPPIPFSLAMIAPRLLGADVVAACSQIVDLWGFVNVDATYRTERYPEVFAAGSAIARPRRPTHVPCDMPRTAFLADRTARIAAHNLAIAIEGGGAPRMLAFPASTIDATELLDMGNPGIVLHGRDEGGWSVLAPELRLAKSAFERWFVATRKHGVV